MNTRLTAFIKRLMTALGLKQGLNAPDFISGDPREWHGRYTKVVETILAASTYELDLARKDKRQSAVPYDEVDGLFDEFNSTREVLRAIVNEDAEADDIRDRCANVWSEAIGILKRLPDPVKIRRSRKR